MSVLCIGGKMVLDRLREKHEFERKLTDAGFRHEEFTLHVRPVQTSSSMEYDVKVTHAPTRTVKGYRGGPHQRWVAQFAADLSGGLYGQPTESVTPGFQDNVVALLARRR